MRKGKSIKLKKKYISNNTNKKTKSLKLQKPWMKRSFYYSPYPYLLIVSCFRRNVFFNVTNYKGQTKHWTSSGRSGFKGKTRIEHMALITVTENFMKKIWNQGIRHLLLVFKNYNIKHKAIVRGIKLNLKKKYSVKFISLTIQMQNVFNGCRNKKKRRR